MRVLVTGASGFLGSHVIDALIESGHEPIAAVRERTKSTWLDERQIECARVSFTTGDGLENAFRDVSAIIHCAGGGKIRTLDEAREQNVVPTQTLLAAVEKLPIKIERFVLASSIAAAPGAIARSAVDANHFDPQPRSAYGQAKREAENSALAFASRVQSTILRFPSIYGPRDTRWLPIFRAASFGIIPRLGDSHPLSLIYVTDAARACVDALTKPHASGRIYAIEDGNRYTQSDIGNAIARALQRPAFELRIPNLALHALARLPELLGPWKPEGIFLTRDKVNDLLGDGWVCDSTPLREELGWTSTVQLDDGMRRTHSWLREQQYLR